GDALPLSRALDTGIEARRQGVVVVGNLSAQNPLVDRGGAGDELAGGIARHGDLVVVALAEHAEADRLHAVGAYDRWDERDVHLLARLQRSVWQRAAGGVGHGPGLPGLGTETREGAHERVAALGLDYAHLASLEVVAGVLRLEHRLGDDGCAGRKWLGRIPCCLLDGPV